MCRGASSSDSCGCYCQITRMNVPAVLCLTIVLLLQDLAKNLKDFNETCCICTVNETY